MKYVDGKAPVVSGLKRISKPGLRVYARKTDIPRVLGGLGIVIVSTSPGHHDRRTGSQGPARWRSPGLRLVGDHHHVTESADCRSLCRRGSSVTIDGPSHHGERPARERCTGICIPDMLVAQEVTSRLVVTRPDELKFHRQLHGLTRTLVANMVEGVTNGYRKGIEITGVGYRASKVGNKLQLNLGYSHPIEIDPPAGISFEVENPTRLAVLGIDKELVGQIAAKVRSMRKPEPYKGKGVRYAGEKIRRKAGKAGKIGGKK